MGNLRVVLMLFVIVLLIRCDSTDKHRFYIKTKYYTVTQIEKVKSCFGKEYKVIENQLIIHNGNKFFELSKEERKEILNGARTNIKCENKRR